MRSLFRLFGASLFFAAVAHAGTLPGGLSPGEIDHVVEVVGAGSAMRLLRSAEPYDAWPGVKLGLEIAMLPARDLNQLGDGTGNAASLNPVPRLYLAKGLLLNLDLILTYFPASFANSLSTYGAMLKWTYYNERENWVSAAVFLGVTKVSAYDSTYTGTDEEVGVVLSKDYVRVRPYLGAGVLFTQGRVTPVLARTPQNSGGYNTVHSFLGAELEMPINFTAQIDLMNLALGGTLMVGKKF